MRISTLLLALVFPSCYLVDPDSDGLYGTGDCNPNSVAPCLEETDDTDTDTDTDTAPPCEESTWYADADLDGYGDAKVVTEACEQPDGYVASATDCDDADDTTFPGASERCDGADNDCDGDVDETLSSTWYNDADDDGYGNAGESVDAADCDGEDEQDFLVDNGDDCDDGDAEVSPDADEVCDDIDNDCDGEADESDAIDAATWYADGDGDGDGDAESSTAACNQPEGYVASATDCDDANSAIFTGNTESCDGLDNDCDGSPGADETDDDLDGYTECADADCDDADIDTFPGAPETCDGADNDCDGFTDESDSGDVATWYYDGDGDGYGDADEPLVLCDQPAGYVADATDCDDGDAEVSPGATEVCNETDDDCDGDVDEDASDATVWSPDADGDGFGDDAYGGFVLACEEPSGYVSDTDDCDDADAAVNPDAAEVYDDLVDNDCNGTVDDAGAYCCADVDLDGYGDPDDCVYEETGECSDSGDVVGDGDCDDSNASVNPGAYDSAHDTVDADCDGAA